MKKRLSIYIFSYNRGQFLENCLESVKANCPDFPVTVIDDNSQDDFTKSVLEKYKNDFKVITPDKLTSSEHKTGGLYSNMRLSLEVEKHNSDYILFLQDDMQMVREITKTDLVNLDLFFQDNPNCCQLQTCFLKRFFEDRDNKHLTLAPSEVAYFRHRQLSGYTGFSGFSAVGIFNINRFYSLFGELRQGEYKNNEFAQNNNIKMGLYRFPFMMWLPFPKSNRGKKRSYSLQIVEYLGGCGYYPYENMDSSASNKLLNASPESLPVAEYYLKTDATKISDIWSFAGGISNLRARKGIYGYLAKILDLIQKIK